MLEKFSKKNNRRGLTMIALVVTVMVLAILTGVIIDSTFGDEGFVEEAENTMMEQKRKIIVDKIAKEIQTEQLKKKINGQYTFTIAEDVMVILEKYGHYDNLELKLITDEGIEIYLPEIMQIPMLEYATITYEDTTLTITSPLTDNGYVIEYTSNNGASWNEYNSPVYITDPKGIYARIKDSDDKVVSNTIKVKEGTMQTEDITPPLITIAANTETGPSIDVTIFVTEFGELASDNIYQYYVSTSAVLQQNGEWKNYTPGVQFTIQNKVPGTYYIHVRSVRDAVGNASDITVSQALTTTASQGLVSIEISTNPTLTYNYGDIFSTSGMAVIARYSDGTINDVTSSCTTYPENGATLTHNDTTLTVTYGGKAATKPITINKVSMSIEVTTPPIKTVYDIGQTFNKAGMVVIERYSDNSTANITNSCTFNPTISTPLTESHKAITITYNGKTTTQPIIVGATTFASQSSSIVYGQPVDYSVTVGTATYTDWQIYYATNEYVFLIKTNPITNVSLSANGDVAAANSSSIYNIMKLGQTGYALNSSYNNSKAVATLVNGYSAYANTSAYTDVEGNSYVVGAIGGPTIELVQARANTISAGAATLTTDTNGYKINGSYLASFSTGLPNNSEYIKLASPSNGDLIGDTNSVMLAFESGVRSSAYSTASGVSPVVCLKTSIPAIWSGYTWEIGVR